MLRIHDILARGDKVGMKILEWVRPEAAEAAEMYWIGFFVSSGLELVNNPLDIKTALVDYHSGRHSPSVLLADVGGAPDFVSGAAAGLASADIPQRLADERVRRAQYGQYRADRTPKVPSRRTLLRGIKSNLAKLDAVELQEIISCAAGRLGTLRKE